MFRLAPFSLSLILAAAVVTPSLAATDKQFITDAIKGDNSEMMLGQLAMQKAASPGVKSFGQTLVTDHGQAKTDAAAVAKTIGVTPPTTIMPEADAELAKLKRMSGAKFDAEFVSYMVKDHKKDISDFKEEAAKGSGAVASLASKTLPTLEKHLQIAQSLQTGGK
jgi:putative membrane protein